VQPIQVDSFNVLYIKVQVLCFSYFLFLNFLKVCGGFRLVYGKRLCNCMPSFVYDDMRGKDGESVQRKDHSIM
jgi:hypothetical protein